MAKQTPLHPFFAKIIKFFQSLTLAILAGEGSVIEFAVALGLWAVYLTPAHMTWKHLVDTMNFHVLFAYSTAISVEVLGIASGHTLARLYQHNKDNRAKRDKVSLWPLFLTYGLYLGIITSINVVLDFNTLDTPTLVARIGLILLTTPAIVIVAVRSQHREILARSVRASTPVQERSEHTKKRSARSKGVPQTTLVIQHLNKEHQAGQYNRVDDVPSARTLARTLDVAPSSAQRARNQFIEERVNGTG